MPRSSSRADGMPVNGEDHESNGLQQVRSVAASLECGVPAGMIDAKPAQGETTDPIWHAILQSTSIGLVLLSARGDVRAVNDAALRLAAPRRAADIPTGIHRWIFCAPDGTPYGPEDSPLREALSGARLPADRPCVVQTAEGPRHVSLSITLLGEVDPPEGGFVVTLAPYSPHQLSTARDPLTGLATRAALQERLAQATSLETPVALLLADLDHFKEVNDTLGHRVGDQLLLRVAVRLRTAMGEGQVFARLGGDEFAVLMPAEGDEAPRLLAQRIIAALEMPFIIGGRMLTVRASIGIARFPSHSRDADTLLRHADVAMYAAKRSGGGIAAYQQESDPHSPERLALLMDLRRGIEADQLFLCFQPQLDVRTGEITSVEALARWQHPRLGLIPPDRFIPLVEQHGMVDLFTRWVLGAALTQSRIWRQVGLNVRIAVNLSARNLRDPQLPDLVAGMIASYQATPADLELEITESTLVADPEAAQALLSRLADIGVKLALDDFGIGYSSLSHLRRLPVHTLKIDKSFIRDMHTDSAATAIVQSVVELAHNLGLRVIAEGVEDQLTQELLRQLGCDLIQGYHLSKPLPAAEITRWLSARPI